MLQVESLARWQDPAAEDFRQRTGFSGIFIPTDIVWSRQYAEVVAAKPEDAFVPQCLSWLFVYHVLECFSRTLIFRASRSGTETTYKQVSLSIEDEQALVDVLSSSWGVVPRIPSLRSLCDAVIHRSLDLSKALSDYIAGRSGFSFITSMSPAPIAQLLSATVGLVNNAFNEAEGKWCFLFDELELAPSIIVDQLIPLLRSGDPNIIYKLSLVPFLENLELGNTFRSPMVDHDYSIVELTRFEGREEKKFAEALCSRVFSRQGYMGSVSSYFKEPEWESYESQVVSLAAKDPGFLQYLSERGIDPEKLPESDESGRWLIRKIRWVIFLRNHYFSRDAQRLKSYKTPPKIYVGFDGICQALEYNPRMLIGTMNKLAQRTVDRAFVPIVDQLEILADTETAFSALLNTIPIQNEKIGTVAKFVEEIGRFVADSQIYGEKFVGEPKGSFSIPSNTAPWLLEAIKQSLNTGAAVRVASGADWANSIPQEPERFRLSNLFAHRFHIPTTLMRQVSIQEVIEGKPSGYDPQLELL